MRTAWASALVVPPLAMILLFFVAPVLYLFWVSLHEASPSELYGAALTLQTTPACSGTPSILRSSAARWVSPQ